MHRFSGRRRLQRLEVCPSLRSTLLTCFRMLYFRILASRIPSVLLGTSALLITAFCTEIFELSIPIGYPYSRNRHPQVEPSARAPFEGVPVSRLSDEGGSPEKQVDSSYSWSEHKVCGREPFASKQKHTSPCRAQWQTEQAGLAPANPRSALDPRNFQRARYVQPSADRWAPECPERPSAACFARVRTGSLCFLHDRVVICQNHKTLSEEIQTQPSLPNLLRFKGEEVTLPVKASECKGGDDSQRKSPSRLALVADDRFLPLHKPNPYHEAEKLIPAILFRKQHTRVGDSRSDREEDSDPPHLFWFKDPTTLSVWAQGFLKVFNISLDHTSNLHRRRASVLTEQATAEGKTNSAVSDQYTHRSLLETKESNDSLEGRDLKEGDKDGVHRHPSSDAVTARVVPNSSPGSSGHLSAPAADEGLNPSAAAIVTSEAEWTAGSREPVHGSVETSSEGDGGRGQLANSSSSRGESEAQTEEALSEGVLALDERPFLSFEELPREGELPLCFDDAVILSPPTNGAFVPDAAANDWLRSQVLQHCGIPEEPAPSLVKKALILDRPPGTRRLANKEEVIAVLNEVVGVDVEQQVNGIGTFCDQARAVASQDFLVVPHGSQNVNFIFAKPGAIVIEILPYLFYTNVFGNYIHAAGLQHFQLLGKRPPWSPLLWMYSWLGWDACFDMHACKNHARRQDVYVDTQALKALLSQLVNDCTIVGEASPERCRTLLLP